MAILQSITIFPEVLRSIASSTFNGAYQTVGSILANPSRVLKFTNGTNVQVLLSWNGTDPHEVMPANSSFVLDIAANKQISQIFAAATGVQFYVNGASSGENTGSFYISSYYAS